jgi:hypothetical protein
VLAANSGEFRVWNEQHVAPAVYVVNLEQLGSWSALPRSNVDRAAVAVAGEDSRPWPGLYRVKPDGHAHRVLEALPG